MKRRKKAVYVDYDYEAAYQKMLTDLEEGEKIDKATSKIKQKTAKKKTKKKTVARCGT